MQNQCHANLEVFDGLMATANAAMGCDLSVFNIMAKPEWNKAESLRRNLRDTYGNLVELVETNATDSDNLPALFSAFESVDAALNEVDFALRQYQWK